MSLLERILQDQLKREAETLAKVTKLILEVRSAGNTKLSLSHMHLRKLPVEIAEFTELVELNLSNNDFNNFPAEINHLTNLTKLDLSSNYLKALPNEIENLIALTWFDISNNKLTELPIELNNLPNLFMLDLSENKLPIPPEISDKVYDPAGILNYYFLLNTEKKKPLGETKILVVGQGSVGKTSLIKRLISGEFNINEIKTEGIEIKKWLIDNEVEDEQIKLNIWDFGGQEIMHATHQFFLTKRSIYLLVLDSRLSQEENRAEYWLKIIHSFGGDSPIIIVGNKADQNSLDIDSTGLKKKYTNIVDIIETSAATGLGIETLDASIYSHVNRLPHIRDLLPESWFKVKNKIENLGQKRNFITRDDYFRLCRENNVTEEISQTTLIGFLHDLGVVLYFQDDARLECLGILNPQWVTNGVYKIINAKNLFRDQGMLMIAMLNEILNLPEYPRDKRLFIVDMMKKFELCYDLEADKTFLVPDLLPKDEPVLDFHGLAAFEYHYPVLPSSVMTRFIVRMNQKIDNNQVWRSGVLLKIGENLALIKADLEDRTVRIAIDGIEHTRRDVLAAIRYQLDEIHASIKGLNPEKYVPVSGAEPQRYEFLLKLERDGVKILPVPGRNGNEPVMVDISQLLSGIESEAKRREQTGDVYNINMIHVSGNVDGNIIMGDGNSINSTSSDGES